MDTDKYKPYIAHDKQYIEKVANSIKGKAPLEEISFNLLTDVLSELGIKDDPYQFVNLEKFDAEAISRIAHDSFEILNRSEVNTNLKTQLYSLWDYLVPVDELQKSDLIFVFGSAEENSARKAAELYTQGWAPKIMFTGNTAAYLEKTGSSEAEHFATIAEKAGVSREAMLLETQSINTPENVIKGLGILKEKNLQSERIILITFERHMRRASLTFRAVLDWPAQLIHQPAPSSNPQATRERYFESEKIWTYVMFEYIKLYGARLMKHF